MYSLSDGGGWSKCHGPKRKLASRYPDSSQSIDNSQAIVTTFCNHYYLVILQQP